MSIRKLESPSGDFLKAAAELDVSLLIPARSSAEALENTVREAIRYFDSRFAGSYEIILIPNPARADHADKSVEVAQTLAKKFQNIRVVPHLPDTGPPGKGAALRTGIEKARGRWIFFTDADLPYELDFFGEAADRLKEGYALVTGNRRLLTSQFDMPVGLLHLAYGRHRLGLLFNRAVRMIFPVKTSDTQAGIKAMSRELARDAFARMECPGFFFDLELFLAARRLGYRHLELPVLLHLRSEKSTVRILRESALAAYWLTRIALRDLRGEYGQRSSL